MFERFKPDEMLLMLSFLSFFVFIICRLFARIFESNSVFLSKLSSIWLVLSLAGFAGFVIWK